jgi:hypothetical protein
VKLGSLSGGDHRWFKRSTRKKRPVTRHDVNNNNKNNNNDNNNKATAESVNNLMRQWNTSYQHAQYWQKNNT